MAGLNIPPGLLQFCLRHGDDPQASTLPQRDPQDYEWLKEALGGMESEVDVMKKVISKLTSPETTIDQRRILLEELQYLVEDLDNANELHKIGGLQPVLDFLSSSEDDLTRMWSAWILTSLVQNNPKGVLTALQHQAFETVLSVLQKETHPETRVRLLSAISGFLTAEDPTITNYFLERNGLELLSLALDRTPKERLRALTILRTLLRLTSTRQPELKDLYRQQNILFKVTSILKEETKNTTTETTTEKEDLQLKALGLLSDLVEGNPTNWRQLTQGEEGTGEESLKDWVQQHLSKLLQEHQLKKQEGEESEPIDPLWYSFLKQLRSEPTPLPTPVPVPAPSTSTQPLLLL